MIVKLQTTFESRGAWQQELSHLPRFGENMTQVYIYKLTVDDGGAPCVHDGVWTLAICKPAIRSTAEAD